MRSDARPSPSSADSAHTSTQATSCDTLAVDWDLSAVDGTTLVTVRVMNTLEHPRQLRIDNQLDGPVSSPQRQGVPDSNEDRDWDADGVSVSVAPGETVSVGYACWAPPQTPPVTVRDGADISPQGPVERALRSLGDHAPPRAALSGVADAEVDANPDTDADPDSNSAADENVDADPDRNVDATLGDERVGDAGDERAGDHDEQTCTDESMQEEPNVERRSTSSTDPVVSPPTPPSGSDGLPHTVEAWFDAVEARLDTVGRLSGPVHDATPVIASLGGRAGLETLAATMQSDERALRQVAERATVLVDRLDETAVPTVEAER